MKRRSNFDSLRLASYGVENVGERLTVMTASTYLQTDIDKRYRILRQVGEGASSWVFAARDLRLEREVAVKILKREGTGASPDRLIDEGRTLARLQHPHIVALFDAGGTADGLVYLVMELFSGGTLEEELQRTGPMTVSKTLDLLLPLLGALACAHDSGIIHRDLKPANIALVRTEAGVRAKLLDFGIAKRSDALTSGGLVRGTPAYMAPEQARALPLTPSTDVWSMGVVLFRCLTGRLPFDGETTTQVITRLCGERAPRLRDALPSLPRHLSLALDQALEPDDRARYTDMRKFAQALACASTLDALDVADQPEPLGLPDFASWLADTDLSVTTELPPPKPLGSKPYRRTVPSRLAQTCLLTIAVGSLTSVVGGDTPPRALPQPALPPRSYSCEAPDLPRAAMTLVQEQQPDTPSTSVLAPKLPSLPVPRRRVRKVEPEPAEQPSAREPTKRELALQQAAEQGYKTSWE